MGDLKRRAGMMPICRIGPVRSAWCDSQHAGSRYRRDPQGSFREQSLKPDDLSNLDGETVFETERLRCRRWLPSDVEAIFDVYADPEGSRWVDDGKPIERAECEAWLGVTARNYRGRGYGMFALAAIESDRVLGFAGLVHPGGQPEAEVKYAFRRSVWGRGLASEVVPALIDYGRRSFGLKRVIATVAPENMASRRVLEKSGLILKSTAADERGADVLLYEWLATGVGS